MIFLALNELNIDYVRRYTSRGLLPAFEQLLSTEYAETISEGDSIHLEPWIQWVTVHTGKEFSEHGVFRLGDITQRRDLVQIFEDLESAGCSVGVVSAFNADNRLRHAEFFIPDPWTETACTGSAFLRRVSRAVSGCVNRHSTRGFAFADLFWIGAAAAAYVGPKAWPTFWRLGLQAKKPGVQSMILDLLLAEMFQSLVRKHRPAYAHLFLNAAAHIQHHYLFNSSEYDGTQSNPAGYCPKSWDPLLQVLMVYDTILANLLKLKQTVIVATALSQVPQPQRMFYWRPTDHRSFLRDLGIDEPFEVTSLMSRDFRIEVDSPETGKVIERKLLSWVESANGSQIFSVDNRGRSLFVELVFAGDLNRHVKFRSTEGFEVSNLVSKLAFVAIKNGKHHNIGHVFSNRNLKLQKSIPLRDLYDVVKQAAIAEARGGKPDGDDKQ